MRVAGIRAVCTVVRQAVFEPRQTAGALAAAASGFLLVVSPVEAASATGAGNDLIVSLPASIRAGSATRPRGDPLVASSSSTSRQSKTTSDPYARFEAPTGLWLAVSARTHPASDHKSPRPKDLYGPTSDTADWYINQGNIPSPNLLPPFDADGVSANGAAKVIWLGDGTFRLRQYAATLPCTMMFPSGRRLVDEFDLLASPIHPDVNGPGYPSAEGDAKAAVAALAHLDYAITARTLDVRVLDATCPTTKATAVAAVTLSNRTAKQTLFYQIRLGHYDPDHAGLGSRDPLVTTWFFTGTDTQTGRRRTYGYADDIESYGKTEIRGAATTYAIDLLPRLKEIIARSAGATDAGLRQLDRDLSHWTVGGTYVGNLLWGHMAFATQWSGFRLRAIPRPVTP